MGYCRDCANFTPNGSFNRGFCSVLYDWKKDPKAVKGGDSCNKFTPETYDDAGFKSSGCYLTSACVSYLGKADDCEELTKLRAFRDNYMKKSDKYSALVDEYYKVAPEIVKKIDESDKRDEYYSYIYDEVCRCIALIDGDKKEEAVAEYKKMTEYLMGKLKLTKGL